MPSRSSPQSFARLLEADDAIVWRRVRSITGAKRWAARYDTRLRLSVTEHEPGFHGWSVRYSDGHILSNGGSEGTSLEQAKKAAERSARLYKRPDPDLPAPDLPEEAG